jgi:hypothetical protein
VLVPTADLGGRQVNALNPARVQGSFDGSFAGVGSYTQTASPGDPIVLNGGFPAGGTFKVWNEATTAYEDQTVLARQLSTATVKIGANLPANSVYVLYPHDAAANTRFGLPVAVNAPEAWWAGATADTPWQNDFNADNTTPTVATGDTLSFYGRNLSYDGSSNLTDAAGVPNAWVYIRKTDGTGGQWVNATSVDPYKVDFTMPAGLTAGSEYYVWVNNRRGGDFGWSAPLKFKVDTHLAWTKTVTIKSGPTGRRCGAGRTSRRSSSTRWTTRRRGPSFRSRRGPTRSRRCCGGRRRAG